jgi:hypothetical protein
MFKSPIAASPIANFVLATRSAKRNTPSSEKAASISMAVRVTKGA